MKVSRSVLVPFEPEQMFDVVNDVAAYPSFLPGCTDAVVQQSTPTTMRATLKFRRAGISFSFTTDNTLLRPCRIDLSLVDGPFSKLSGRWTFEALGEDGCRVALSLDFAVSALTAIAVESLFGRMADEMVDAFSERAEQLHSL